MYTSLQKIVTDFQGIFPEVCLFVFILLLLAADLIGKKKFPLLLPIGTVIGFVFTILFIALQFSTSAIAVSENKSLLLYSNFLKLDYYASYFKILFCLSGILSVIFTLFSSDYKREEKGEFYYLLTTVVLGLHLLVMSNNLLMMFVSLEIISIGSYLLTIFNFDKKGTESAIKYILFGAFCSGIMLFGISLLYGINGNFNFPTALSPLALANEGLILFVFAIFLTLTGLFFKISAFPYHVWAPDIYEGAPAPVVAFFSIAPKAAALAVLIRILSPLLLNSEVTGILTLLLAILAMITMTIGNFSALMQKNLRRMLAYSAIGHAGFMLMAIITVKELAVNSILFYLAVYLFMNFTAFCLVDVFASKAKSMDVNNFKGLGLKMPFLGGIFVLTMISLTGLPPTAGFYAKLFVFSALWESYQITGNQIFLILLAFGLLNTIVSLFYYLRIPYFIYFKKEDSDTILTSEPRLVYIFITLISLPLLILFFNPNWVLNVLKYIKL
ncbi:MAG TPA: NADH-quinone oxidoreductase subunit N [Cytophagaceae bacterium]|nr:NADH-quinone oxidoreductase subunit N [Cytophagaceae bacterium]